MIWRQYPPATSRSTQTLISCRIECTDIPNPCTEVVKTVRCAHAERRATPVFPRTWNVHRRIPGSTQRNCAQAQASDDGGRPDRQCIHADARIRTELFPPKARHLR